MIFTPNIINVDEEFALRIMMINVYMKKGTCDDK